MDTFTPPLSHSNPPAPLPLNENIYESATAAVESPNSASTGNAHVDNIVNDLFVSLSGYTSGDFLGLIGGNGLVDEVEDAPALPTPPPMTLFNVRIEEGAGRPHFHGFSSLLPTLENRFSN